MTSFAEALLGRQLDLAAILGLLALCVWVNWCVICDVCVRTSRTTTHTKTKAQFSLIREAQILYSHVVVRHATAWALYYDIIGEVEKELPRRDAQLMHYTTKIGLLMLLETPYAPPYRLKTSLELVVGNDAKE